MSDDISALLSDPSHEATIGGSIVAPDLSPHPLQARGTFRLFESDPTRVETTRMCYRLELIAADGRLFDFEGHKVINGRGVANVWHDTTTLFFTVTERAGHQTRARGLLRVSLADLVRLVRTIEVTHTPNARQRAKEVERFLRVFLRVLWRTYADVLALNYDFQPVMEDPPRQLNAPLPEGHDVATQDGAHVRLTRYQGGSEGPVIVAPGFGVTADSYAASTVEENLVERLTKDGYDVWLLDYRASPLLVGDDNPRSAEFSVDDIADYDWPDTVAYVRDQTGAASVQAVVHCVASMSFLMAMTQGLQGVRSAVCSQLTLHAPTNFASRAKAALRAADIFQHVGLRVLNTNAPPTPLNRALDIILHLNPVLKGQRCHNPVCRRIFAIFGPSYRHEQLNEATHRHIHAWFGATSDIALKQLATIVRKGVAVDAAGGDRYLPRLDRVDLPILFLAGEENQEFFPTASALTMRQLREVNRPDLYTRVVLPDYGHMDCFIGRSAATDVFPVIMEHLATFPLATRPGSFVPADGQRVL